ncbi:MAG: hypothetical protein ACK5ME_07425, partial [Parahaliea sp.]
VGAPQAFISTGRVEAVGFGEGTILISLAQQALFTVDEVGAVCAATFSYVFGDSSAEGVVLVVRLQGGRAFSGGGAAVAGQSVGGVVAVASGRVAVAFLQGVALRAVVDLCINSRALVEGRGTEGNGLRILRELVVGVVVPYSALVGAAGAVAHSVVSVPLHRQAEGLQGRIRGGLGQPVEAVVAVICLAQFAAELRDVTGAAVLVLPLAQALAAAVAVADLDGQGALPAIVGECSGDAGGADLAGAQPLVLAITLFMACACPV